MLNKPYKRHVETVEIGRPTSKAYKSLLGIFIILVVLAIPFFVFQNKYSNIQTQYASIYDENLVTGNSHIYDKNKVMSLLVIGVDQINGATGEQATFLSHFTLNNSKSDIIQLSIPSRLAVYDSIEDKDVSIAKFYGRYGTKSTIAILEELLQVVYDYILVIQVPHVRDVIESLDGIDVTLAQEVTINNDYFPSNQPIHLNGRQAHLLLSYKTNNDANEYKENIHAILSSMMYKSLDMKSFWRLDSIINAAENSIRTNIPFEMYRDIYLGYYNESMNHLSQYNLEGNIEAIDSEALIYSTEIQLDFIRNIISN